MSREAWGDPPDPEPQFCPVCGEQSHVEGCELGAMQKRALDAEGEARRMRKLLQAADVLFAPLCRDATAWTWLDDTRAALGKTPNAELRGRGQKESGYAD